MLKYALYPNPLTKGEDDYRAIPQSLENDHIEDVIKQITIPGSILKETECVAVIHEFFRIISENLKEGRGFVSEYIRIQPSISGVFVGQEDQFDVQRHHKQINISASQSLKEAIGEMKVEKVPATDHKPIITSVLDFKTGELNKVLTPGQMIKIHGRKLKVNLSLEDEGIYLINTSNDIEIPIAQVHDNFPSRLTVMTPEELDPGTYQLEVRARMRKNKRLSIGTLPDHLQVL